MFIPVLNCFSLFIWLYNYSRMPSDVIVFLKSLLVIFSFSLPLAFICFLIDQLHMEGLLYFTKFIMLYIIPLSISYGLIRFQRKIYKEK